MTRKWTGLPKRFSESSIYSITLIGCSAIGSLSIVPLLFWAQSAVPGTFIWLWLLTSFGLSLGLGMGLSSLMIRLYRAAYGELILNHDTLDFRRTFPHQKISIDLTQPLDIDAQWFGDAQHLRGGVNARIVQDGRMVTLYADSGTAHAGARLGIPHAPVTKAKDGQRIRLHPTQLTEVIELIREHKAHASTAA